MYESRLWKLVVGAIVFVLGLVLMLRQPRAPANLVVYNTYFRSCTSSLSNKLQKDYFGNIQLTETGENIADIIVSADTNYKPNGDYTVDTIAYSPIVADFPDNMAKDDNFSTLTNYKNSSYYMTDMNALLKAVMQSEDGTIDAEKLGYKTKEILTLSIPDNGCTYRRDVVNGIIYILTYGEEVTEENALKVKEQLNTILSKAVNIKDPVNRINYSATHEVILVPEYLLNEQSRYTFHPVYWDNCYAVPLQIYIKNTAITEDTGNLADTADTIGINELADMIKNDATLFRDSYYRNQVRPKKTCDQSYTADTLSIVYGQDNLEELLGIGYWKYGTGIKASE